MPNESHRRKETRTEAVCGVKVDALQYRYCYRFIPFLLFLFNSILFYVMHYFLCLFFGAIYLYFFNHLSCGCVIARKKELQNRRPNCTLRAECPFSRSNHNWISFRWQWFFSFDIIRYISVLFDRWHMSITALTLIPNLIEILRIFHIQIDLFTYMQNNAISTNTHSSMLFFAKKDQLKYYKIPSKCS